MNTLNQQNKSDVLQMVVFVLIILNAVVVKAAYIYDSDLIYALYITIPFLIFLVYNLKK